MGARGHGAVGAMRRWFAENPNEFLSLDDLVDKFGFTSRRTAIQGVYVLRMEGLLTTELHVFADPERPRLGGGA